MQEHLDGQMWGTCRDESRSDQIIGSADIRGLRGGVLLSEAQPLRPPREATGDRSAAGALNI